ncbi:MAG: UvrD-helicase domain-containing protein [Corynebacterium sp.]|nr:UvrD-helicase domain-containing protein [Corynebacterium sp.]
MLIDPVELSRLLGQKFPPTAQQADVIQADLEPMLVVAGAGAGKTETMAARVVWLVANGLIEPDRILGLTFTRKAAQELGKRIRTRLEQLANIPDINALDPSGELAHRLHSIAPITSTYDAFAGSLVGEFGLLLPVEPSSRVISNTELYRIAFQLVGDYDGTLSMEKHDTVVEKLLDLTAEMDNHMIDADELKAESLLFSQLIEELPKGPGQRNALNAEMLKWQAAQLHRIELLPLVKRLKEKLREDNLVTFAEQMSAAARLAEENPSVGAALRRRFQIILLDEYQDTNHAQRILLRSFFSGAAVTAVGDPMQSIYGWRGATSSNLQRFITDFARPNTHALKKELTMSFRNPPEVLDLANRVATQVLGAPTDPKRPVQPLVSRPEAPSADIHLGFFATYAEEHAYVADTLAELYRNRSTDPEDPFTAAILLRRNSEALPIAQELQQRGVPYEIISSEGLLDVPEVADMIAVATMLIRPTDSTAALRLLAGPAVGLGVADIKALARRAGALAGRAVRAPQEYSDDPTVKLDQILKEVVDMDSESAVGLTDAIADLGDKEEYSAEGYRRLARLSSQLRQLRQTVAAGSSLPDIFAEIERVMGIRTEVLSREDPHGDGVVGTVHLDALHKEVADFAAIPNSTLGQLLDYFRMARQRDKGLQLGEVQVRSDRVQILTVHKAKGLEWQTVCVLHADGSNYDNMKGRRPEGASTWLTQASQLPTVLRGDAAEAGDEVGTPILDTTGVENRKELEEAGKAHKNELSAAQWEESTRLFYVAITRAERRLLVTASELDETGNRAAVDPCKNLLLLKDHVPEENIVEWFVLDPEAEVREPVATSGFFPKPTAHCDLMEGADLVRSAMADLIPFNQDHDLFQLWEKDVTALIEEQERLQSDVVEVELSTELTATDIVSLKQSPDQFARRQRRPVPFKPNRYAKRGTEFHSWLEQRFGLPTLLDESELPGMDEEVTPVQLQVLKQKFLAGQFADRTPTYIEQPFEISVDGLVIRGRMDAVFYDQDGWHIVDWKTGQPPSQADMQHLMMQLAVYRIAWAQLKNLNPDDIRASFYYVQYDQLTSADDLPSEQEIADVLRAAVE